MLRKRRTGATKSRFLDDSCDDDGLQAVSAKTSQDARRITQGCEDSALRYKRKLVVGVGGAGEFADYVAYEIFGVAE